MSVVIVERDTKTLYIAYDGNAEKLPSFYNDEKRFIHIRVPDDLATYHYDDYLVLDDFTLCLIDSKKDELRIKEWEAIRAERNKLLSATDWRMARDIQYDERWAIYRETLRQFPQNHESKTSPPPPFPPAPEP